LGINQAGASKSMEKLSSGFRINRAGDDAAGLAISEKMRGQIRGLTQASRNAQDGISLIQTAEGALNETHAILQRMRELAVQSSTDTNEDPDRIEIQEEINQLAEELSRIASDTEFNNQKLLDGTYSNKVFHIGANEGQNVKLTVGNMDANTLKVAGSGEGVATTEISASNNASFGTGISTCSTPTPSWVTCSITFS
jgi:flagellin